MDNENTDKKLQSKNIKPTAMRELVLRVLTEEKTAISLVIIQRSKGSGVHMKASIIFTANDVIINAGVILAGVLVLLTNSKYTDLIIGSIVFLVVIRGAVRILKLGR